MEKEDHCSDANGSNTSDDSKKHQEASGFQKSEDKTAAHEDGHGHVHDENDRSAVQKWAGVNKKQKMAPATCVSETKCESTIPSTSGTSPFETIDDALFVEIIKVLDCTGTDVVSISHSSKTMYRRATTTLRDSTCFPRCGDCDEPRYGPLRPKLLCCCFHCDDGRIFCFNCIDHCSDCGRYYCKKCSKNDGLSRCSGCGNTCPACVSSCDTCRQAACDDCGFGCDCSDCNGDYTYVGDVLVRRNFRGYIHSCDNEEDICYSGGDY
mmetsp:Transcript_48638/g.72608  ORF Transcript_48638/g.72608 Transcript_48638/m.72608 type:complete len:266 (-) Transcript_48638:151-948(-)